MRAPIHPAFSQCDANSQRPVGRYPPPVATLLAFCDGLADELGPQAAASEAARRVPPAVMRRLAALGLFRLALPA